MNSRIVIAIAVSAGMALLVTGIFYQMAFSGRSTSRETPTMEVVIAVKDLEIGSTVAAKDLKLQQWPSANLPNGAFSNIEEVIDRTPVSRVLAGEPILERRLAARGSGVGLSTKVPEGMRAMSVRVDDVNGVAGFVIPEARVDLLITGAPHSDRSGERRTKTILGNIRVLSAGEHLTPDGSGRPQRVPVVTLLLTPEQSEMVTLAQSQGRIQLVLRNSNDEEIAETTGVHEDDLYGVRQTINVSNPAPRPVVRAPIEPPPPPPIEIEMIHGAKRSRQTFEDTEGSN